MNLTDGVYFVFEPFIEFFFYVAQLLNCIIGANNGCEYVDKVNKTLFQILGISDLYRYFVFILKCVVAFSFYHYLMLQCASTQNPGFLQMDCDFVWYEPVIGFFVCTFIAFVINCYMKKNQLPPPPIVFHHHHLQSSIFAGG